MVHRPVIAIVLILAVAGCGQKPATNSTTPGGSGPAPTQPVPSESVLSASQITRDYATDGKGFNAKYKGKVVVVEGLVTSPDAIDEGKHWTILAGYEKPGDPVCYKVNCAFVGKDQDKAAGLAFDSWIKVRGQCLAHSDTRSAVCLLECTLLDVEARVSLPLLPSEKAISVGDAQLAMEYAADEMAADKKYGTRAVEIDGTVHSSGYPATELYLLGTFDLKKMSGRQVYCQMAPAARAKAEVLTPGQKVKVRGRCRSAGKVVFIENAELTHVGVDPALPLTAAGLTEAYAKGEEAADKRYKNQQVSVEGVVAEVGKTTDMQPIIFLQGFDGQAAKPLRVEAILPVSDTKPVAGLTKGQKIQVKGECVGKKGDNVLLWYVKVLR